MPLQQVAALFLIAQGGNELFSRHVSSPFVGELVLIRPPPSFQFPPSHLLSPSPHSYLFLQDNYYRPCTKAKEEEKVKALYREKSESESSVEIRYQTWQANRRKQERNTIKLKQARDIAAAAAASSIAAATGDPTGSNSSTTHLSSLPPRSNSRVRSSTKFAPAAPSAYHYHATRLSDKAKAQHELEATSPNAKAEEADGQKHAAASSISEPPADTLPVASSSSLSPSVSLSFLSHPLFHSLPPPLQRLHDPLSIRAFMEAQRLKQICYSQSPSFSSPRISDCMALDEIPSANPVTSKKAQLQHQQPQQQLPKPPRPVIDYVSFDRKEQSPISLNVRKYIDLPPLPDPSGNEDTHMRYSKNVGYVTMLKHPQTSSTSSSGSAVSSASQGMQAAIATPSQFTDPFKAADPLEHLQHTPIHSYHPWNLLSLVNQEYALKRAEKRANSSDLNDREGEQIQHQASAKPESSSVRSRSSRSHLDSSFGDSTVEFHSIDTGMYSTEMEERKEEAKVELQVEKREEESGDDVSLGSAAVDTTGSGILDVSENKCFSDDVRSAWLKRGHPPTHVICSWREGCI